MSDIHPASLEQLGLRSHRRPPIGGGKEGVLSNRVILDFVRNNPSEITVENVGSVVLAEYPGGSSIGLDGLYLVQVNKPDKGPGFSVSPEVEGPLVNMFDGRPDTHNGILFYFVDDTNPAGLLLAFIRSQQ